MAGYEYLDRSQWDSVKIRLPLQWLCHHSGGFSHSLLQLASESWSKHNSNKQEKGGKGMEERARFYLKCSIYN